MEKKPGPAPEKKQRALKKNPNIKREMRPDLEQAVVKKLENLGVKSVSLPLFKKSTTCDHECDALGRYLTQRAAVSTSSSLLRTSVA